MSPRTWPTWILLVSGAAVFNFRISFTKTLSPPAQLRPSRLLFPPGLQIGLGSRTAASEIIQQQGDFNQTGNPLDITIQGPGFFQIQLPSGEIAYTRSGAFHLDQTGIIVDAQGNQLQPALTVPASATNITIGTDGTVSVTLPNQAQAQQVGSIQLATFANPGGLISVGNNYFLETKLERTGTVVMGGNVSISSCSILHGTLSIQVSTEFQVSQPAPFSKTGQTTITPQTTVQAQEAPAQVVQLKEGATVEELVRGLRTLGATARDNVAILQGIKSAGA